MTFRDWLSQHDAWAAAHPDHKATYQARDLEAAWNAAMHEAAKAVLAQRSCGLAERKTPAEAGAEGALLSV